MTLSDSICSWLAYSAMVSLAVLAVGSAAALACRQPARRLLIIELTLASCLLVPWLRMIPGYPRLAVAWRHAPAAENDHDEATSDTWPMEDAAAAPLARNDSQAAVVPSGIRRDCRLSPRESSATFAERKATSATCERSPSRLFNVALFVVAAYLSGVAMGIVWWFIGVAALLRTVRASKPADERCRDVLRRIAGERGDRVRLLTSRIAKQPFAAPCWPSLIVLPEDLCHSGRKQEVCWAVGHEWTHIERGHRSAWLAAELVRVVFFYQPLAWWLRRQLRLCQDFVADVGAARQSEPEDYAEFLARRAAAGSLHPAMAALGMGFCKSQLTRRVVMLLQDPPLESRIPRLWTALVSIVAVALIATVPALSITTETAAEEQSKEALPKAVPAAKNIAFTIGPNKCWGGDIIAIEEVRSELGTLAKGDRVTVKGRYVLASRPKATLCFYITTDAKQPAVEEPKNITLSIEAGSGSFEITRPVNCDGHMHLVLYSVPSGQWIGSVYFGTEAQMKEIAGWRDWVEKPPKPDEPPATTPPNQPGGQHAFEQTDKDKYIPPNFDAFFPDDRAGGQKLDRLFQSRDRDTRSDDEILSTVRAGLRRTSQHRTLVLAWIGNRCIWGKMPPKADAIEIMYHAADFRGPNADPYGTRHYAVYFGLSVVRPKSPAILRTLAELCMKVDDPNDLDRVAWGASSQKAALVEYLKPYLESKDEAVRTKGQVVEKIFKGELKAFAWATEQAKKRAQARYAGQLPQIKKSLAEGTSQQRLETLRLAVGQQIILIMDDSFLAAFAAAARDQDERVRNEVARTVGEHWVWSGDPQNPAAIELMMQLSSDLNLKVQYAAVYFGLSTVRNKDEKVIRRLLEIALYNREPNICGRIAWGLKSDAGKTADILREYIRGGTPYAAKAAREIFKDMTGQDPPSQ